MRPVLSLLAFLLLTVGGGLFIGLWAMPGDWYAALAKPSFNPPNWIFGPVWTTLYVLIAIVGWRLWQRRNRQPAMAFWWGQLALNFAWSPSFFVAHNVGLALGVALAMLVCILGVIATAWRNDRLAALLFLPYAAWVGFASVLNGAILALN